MEDTREGRRMSKGEGRGHRRAARSLHSEESWSYSYGMKVITGTVIRGRIEVPEEFATDGAQVVVLAPEAGEPIHLSPGEEQELREAMDAIRRGEFVDGEALLRELRSLPA
jgi:hypothetical protein